MQFPNFNSRKMLEQHIQKTLSFYQPNVFDENGGFFQNFRDDGSIYDTETRHLVGSARFVFNYAMASRYFKDRSYQPWIRHGLKYLETAHRQTSESGYAWVLGKDGVADDSNHCYGLAYVITAGATALLAGVVEGRQSIESAWNIMETHFWDEEAGLYRDEANADFSVIEPYRGQNANLHSCEAMLWAYQATGEVRYLDRAEKVAINLTHTLADKWGNLVWGHYNENWEIDWEYNKDDPKNLFRPWGFQTGHQTEWAKLLLLLHHFRKNDWAVHTAKTLFDSAVDIAWDDENGGLCYGFDLDGAICDGDKYFWVQSATIAAAALLAKTTKEAAYSDWYQKIWEYSWEHLVDHKHGAWFQVLTQDNQKISNKKSPIAKTDYHTMGACYDVLRSGFI